MSLVYCPENESGIFLSHGGTKESDIVFTDLRPGVSNLRLPGHMWLSGPNLNIKTKTHK